MFVQSIIFGCLECVYTSIFLISSSEVHPLPVLVIFCFSQLLLLVLILRSSRILCCSCSKSRSSVEDDPNLSENSQEKSGNQEDEIHLKGSFELENIAKNRDVEMKKEEQKEEQKDNTQVYKDNDIKLKYIPIQKNNYIFKPSIGSNINEEAEGQSNNNRDSMSKDTDLKKIDIDSNQEDDICFDIYDSKLKDVNKSK